MKEAAALFAKKGFTRTSTAEIAEAANTAHGTVFYHFGTKQELLFEIYNNLMEEYLSGLKEVCAKNLSGLETVIRVVKFHFTFAEAHWNEYTILHRDFPFIRDHKTYNFELVRQNNEQSIAYIRSAIENGMQDGSVRPDADADGYARLIKTMLIGIARATHMNTIDFKSSLSVACDFCTNALRSKGA